MTIGLLVAIGLGILVPCMPGLNSALMPLLALLLFLSFVKVNFWGHKWRFLDIVKVFVGTLLMAGIVFLIGQAIGIEKVWLIGFVLTALTPTALSSPVIVDLVKGNVVLVTQVLLSMNVISVVYVPVAIYFFFQESVRIDAADMGLKLFLMVLIPMMIAYFVEKSRFGKVVAKVSDKSSFWILSLVMYIVFSSNSEFIVGGLSENWIYFVVLFGLALVNYGVGALFGFGQSPRDRLTMSISLGYKNSLLSIWIGLTFFSPEVALIPTIYTVCHHLVNSGLIFLKGRR